MPSRGSETYRPPLTAEQTDAREAPPPWPLLEHELRGAIGALTGLVRLLAEDRVPESDRGRVLASLQNATRRASSLASDVGQIARWSRSTDAARASIPLATVLEQALAEREPDAAPIVPDPDASVDLPVIDADAVIKAFAAVARAARHASAGDVACRVQTHPTHVEVLLLPVSSRWLPEAERHPFNTMRAGLGLSALLAATVVHAHGGRLFQDASGAGIGVWFPLTAAT